MRGQGEILPYDHNCAYKLELPFLPLSLLKQEDRKALPQQVFHAIALPELVLALSESFYFYIKVEDLILISHAI